MQDQPLNRSRSSSWSPWWWETPQVTEQHGLLLAQSPGSDWQRPDLPWDPGGALHTSCSSLQTQGKTMPSSRADLAVFPQHTCLSIITHQVALGESKVKLGFHALADLWFLLC